MPDSLNNEIENREIRQIIGAFVLLPYSGYFFALCLTQWFVGHNPWLLVLSGLCAIFGFVLTILHSFVVITAPSRAVVVSMLISCFAGYPIDWCFDFVRADHFTQLPAEAFNKTLIFYFLTNGVILFVGLLLRFLVKILVKIKRMTAANDARY